MKLTVHKRRSIGQVNYFDLYNPVAEEWVWCDDWQEVEDYARENKIEIGEVK